MRREEPEVKVFGEKYFEKKIEKMKKKSERLTLQLRREEPEVKVFREKYFEEKIEKNETKLNAGQANDTSKTEFKFFSEKNNI